MLVRVREFRSTRGLEGYGLTGQPVTHANLRGEGNKLPIARPAGRHLGARVVAAAPGREALPAGSNRELIVRGPHVMKIYFNNKPLLATEGSVSRRLACTLATWPAATRTVFHSRLWIVKKISSIPRLPGCFPAESRGSAADRFHRGRGGCGGEGARPRRR